MRPDILNPLFAEVEALKGVGPTLAKPLARLGLARAIDLLFHLPTGWIDRKAVTELDEGDVGRIIVVTVTPTEYRTRSLANKPKTKISTLRLSIIATDGENAAALSHEKVT